MGEKQSEDRYGWSDTEKKKLGSMEPATTGQIATKEREKKEKK